MFKLTENVVNCKSIYYVNFKKLYHERCNKMVYIETVYLFSCCLRNVVKNSLVVHQPKKQVSRKWVCWALVYPWTATRHCLM